MSELATTAGISKRKILDNINKLKDLNMLERIGKNKTGYWKIKK
jgi:predicted HTH transcriptional regulator